MIDEVKNTKKTNKAKKANKAKKNDKVIKPVRALLSVSDKTGIVEFAKGLSALGVDLLSTGGTAKALREANVEVTEVSDFTGFPEMMEGRVKTLHPKIFAGILGKRDVHADVARAHDIAWVDIVVCNLYPFAQTIKEPDVSVERAIENIDIGGPSMVRACAKNMDWATIIVDHADYAEVLAELTATEGTTFATRKRLAAKAFSHTALYDALIANYLEESPFTVEKTLGFHQPFPLRYGENPHQMACAYRDPMMQTGILQAIIRQGKPLSYNNLLDADAALSCVAEFADPTCVVVKHANPCGVATGVSIEAAFLRAWDADSMSAFGSIIALNEPCNAAVASLLLERFVEVVIAPGFSAAALTLLAEKKNMRLLDIGEVPAIAGLQVRSIVGGVIMQSRDDAPFDVNVLECVTKVAPAQAALDAMGFAWKVVKHIKSNAILVAGDEVTLGVGAGQVSRIDAVDLAIRKAPKDLSTAVLASDAFFPFRDSIDTIARAGIKAIIQPGGSRRDSEVIAACDEHGIAMLFTGKRCFKH